MKKLFALCTVLIFTISSCSSDGEVGPRGPQGPPGEDGLDGLAYTFEETVNFDYYQDDNFYSAFILIGEEIVTINPEADAVLVYRLETIQDNGEQIDLWSLIPQNFFIEDQGTIQYVFSHTVGDVEIFIEGNYDLSDLSTDFTENQTFRVVVVPSDFAATSGVDVSNFNAVMSALESENIEVVE